jgi:hypothetical protein
MRGSILIVGERMEALLFAMDRVRAMGYVPLATRTRDVARRALNAAPMHARATVLFLTDRDTLTDLRSLLAAPGPLTMLVAPTSPPRAALARLATQYGAAICSREDPAPVLEATLVALLTSRSMEVGR